MASIQNLTYWQTLYIYQGLHWLIYKPTSEQCQLLTRLLDSVLLTVVPPSVSRGSHLFFLRCLAFPPRIHQLCQNPQDGWHLLHSAPHPSSLHLLNPPPSLQFCWSVFLSTSEAYCLPSLYQNRRKELSPLCLTWFGHHNVCRLISV